MTSRTSLTAAAAVLVVLAGCSGEGNRGTTDGYVSGNGQISVVAAADREDAPVLEGEDLQGKPLSTEDFAGKTLVLNVWGDWCPPCRKEAPALQKVSEQYADKDVQFLGILNRSKPAAALAFNRKLGITYPSFADQGGTLELGFASSLPSVAVPTTWVVDPDGKVAARVMGEVTAATLAGLIDDVQEGAS
jgi:thiol-disulfide isomerase/thioredoxin